ncbi:hypothetical protein [Stappia indica]|jgi:hypothetical protein|uniref:Uncharacterized protein n=1 Tax=Stappia indica TaxID=538381 RepID=A0A285TYE0_9HYPH|nr:hypothetical protein [Stappia indica]SOC27645.1 hypothetical protein SAMN05421512_1205 [Stappia indica]
MLKTYHVTDKAGPFVAGTRNPGKGQPLRLTEDQARYALIAGEIEIADKPDTSKPQPAKAAKAGEK